MFENSTDKMQYDSSANSLAGSVYEQIKYDILHCEFNPGDKLRLHALREKYGVGLSPIREALSRLAVEKLVTSIEQRGFRVAPVSKRDLEDILDMRTELECLALSRSIDNGDDEWEARIVGAFHRLSLVLRTKDENSMQPNPDWEERHKEFHEALLSACGSPRLFTFVQTLADQSSRYRRLAAKYSNQPRADNREHKKIMDAVLARDKDKAASLLVAHLRKTVKIVLAQQI